MEVIWIYVAIGSAAIISLIYFFYTYKYKKIYYDSDISNNQNN